MKKGLNPTLGGKSNKKKLLWGPLEYNRPRGRGLGSLGRRPKSRMISKLVQGKAFWGARIGN